MGNMDINSGVDDTVLLLSNASAQWELKSKAATGRLNFKNLTAGGVPFKLGPNSVNPLGKASVQSDSNIRTNALRIYLAAEYSARDGLFTGLGTKFIFGIAYIKIDCGIADRKLVGNPGNP